MLIALEFDTTVRNISNLNFNIYMSFMISGALELPADLLSILGLNYLGRRWSSSISLFACGITILPCAWLAGEKYLTMCCYFHMHVQTTGKLRLFLQWPHGFGQPMPWILGCSSLSRWLVCWHKFISDDWPTGNANPAEGSGNSLGKCDVHGVSDGFSLYCLFSRWKLLLALHLIQSL